MDARGEVQGLLLPVLKCFCRQVPILEKMGVAHNRLGEHRILLRLPDESIIGVCVVDTPFRDIGICATGRRKEAFAVHR